MKRGVGVISVVGLCGGGLPLQAQRAIVSNAMVGSEAERYLRMWELSSRDGVRSWLARPLQIDDAQALSFVRTGSALWDAQVAVRAPHRVGFVPPRAEFSYNSTLPWGFNDGPVWQGKGLTAWSSVGLALSTRFLSVRFEPLAFVAQNASFDLIVNNDTGNVFANAVIPRTIDLPQRFGSGAYARVDMGESYLRLARSAVGVEIGTEALGWGPSLDNPLLLGNNAGGFPHVLVGTFHPVRTPVGFVSLQAVYGRLTQSAYSPDTIGSDLRLGSGLIAIWSPTRLPTLELGGARFLHRDWSGHFGRAELLAPLGSLLFDAQTAGVDAADNQLATAFARLKVPSVGLEVFGEFGKNDRNGSIRDLTVEPDHNAMWSLGVMKSLRQHPGGEFWSVSGQVVNGRITSLQRIRGQAIVYEHTPVVQGHTLNGQVLGAPLLELTGGALLRLDHWYATGGAGVSIMQRLMPPNLEEGAPLSASRAQWAAEVHRKSLSPARMLSRHAGILFDLNRTPSHDVTSFFVGAGWQGGS